MRFIYRNRCYLKLIATRNSQRFDGDAAAADSTIRHKDQSKATIHREHEKCIQLFGGKRTTLDGNKRKRVLSLVGSRRWYFKYEAMQITSKCRRWNMKKKIIQVLCAMA